jgi:hypothetical protein
MKKFIAILLLGFSGAAFAEAYVDGSKPFIAITDVNRQGEAWAMCSASYDLMAELFESKPAISQRMKEWANGAQVATGMALVMGADITDMTTERFKATWAYSKVAMGEWPKTARTTILFDAEILGAEGQEEFVDKLTATSKICIDNLEAQQVYIDTFREFMKSGMFVLPEE